MQRKFLQEKSLSRNRDNAEKSLNIDLSAKSRLVPYSTISDSLSLNDLYIEERDACENYRMVFTVNPICSNVIYNAVTEPVFKEGSTSATSLVVSAVSRKDENVFPIGTINKSGATVDRIAAIRDTEYTNPRLGGFVYHCGYDIFNNHLLRSDEFEHATFVADANNNNVDVFNTIFDFAVDFTGKIATRTGVIPLKSIFKREAEGETISTKIRTYSLDTLKTMNTAFYEKMRLVDGWYGFYNTGNINIRNITLETDNGGSAGDLFVNRVINNEKACAFIDLYPDRTLYSFIPKVNKYRKRIERNWDCAITYPFKDDEKLFNTINENDANAVKVLDCQLIYTNVGEPIILMHSLFRHTLTPGSRIRLFYLSNPADPATITRYLTPVQVVGVGKIDGTEGDRYFSIRLNDIRSFCGIYLDEETGAKQLGIRGGDNAPTSAGTSFYYKKIENGCDDRYYFRKFKKLKNYEYVECDEDEASGECVPLTKEPAYITDRSPEYIFFNGRYFKKEERPLEYSQNKLAFGENIYGDRVAQVIFSDDICTATLKDNLGRPLSRVYFTTVKTNRGHKEWYEDDNLSAETVEYSHCFGEITSGLDLPADSASTDYNVRKLYNIFSDDCGVEDCKNGLAKILSGAPIGSYSGTPMPIESAITIDGFDEFYGDVVEFSKANFLETTIEKVYHRFNTAQRECLKNEKYYDIYYDELVGDIYDVEEEGASDSETDKFIVSSYTLNQINIKLQGDENALAKRFPGNISPEGYFYSPFTEITLRELNDDVSYTSVSRINFTPSVASVVYSSITMYDPEIGLTGNIGLYVFSGTTSPVNYDFVMGQPFCIYDVNADRTYRGFLSGLKIAENGRCELAISTEADSVSITDKGVEEHGEQAAAILTKYLNGTIDTATTKSAFIISSLHENAPTYAEFMPSSQRLVWRANKKMSELDSESPIYNMPFTNGRLYIHENVNLFLKRQDPVNEYHLRRPAEENPLRRFSFDGHPEIDFDLVSGIIGTLRDAC